MAIADSQSQQQATKTNITTTLNEDQVKRMIQEAKLEIIQQLKEEKPDKKQETGVSGGQDPTQKLFLKKRRGRASQQPAVLTWLRVKPRKLMLMAELRRRPQSWMMLSKKPQRR